MAGLPGRDDAIRLVNELEALAESIDLEEPSAILITDPETGTKTIMATYTNGYFAFHAMERERASGGFPPGCEFEVVPCYPPR